MNKLSRCAIILVSVIIAVIICGFFAGLWPQSVDAAGKRQNGDNRPKLVVITRNDLQGYYSYMDQPQGFEYELAKAFADYMDMDLQMVAGSTWEEIQNALLNKRADIIAGMVTSAPNNKNFAFSRSYITARQVPVTGAKKRPITSLNDLADRTIAVSMDSVHQSQLDAMMAAGVDFHATYFHDQTTDDFVRGVSSGHYDVTLAYDYIAMAYTRHYPNIKIGVVLNDGLELAWAVRHGDKRLLGKINRFLNEMEANGTLERLYNRYFGIDYEKNYNELEVFHRKIKRNMPSYQNIIHGSARRHELDWRLIAAVIYQESQFNPNAVSYKGATGLMQLMPQTAESLGLDAANIYDPHQNITAGARYLKRMYDQFESIDDETQRLRLALASYNAGIGHVLDARKMAEDQSLDKNDWGDVSAMLLLLTKPEHYGKAKYGYCNGKETVGYVNDIMTYYDILKYQGANFKVGFELEELEDEEPEL